MKINGLIWVYWQKQILKIVTVEENVKHMKQAYRR
jgi:hypothetical protein